MASRDREEISSRLGGVTVSRVSPSHSQAVVPPQVIHKSNRRRGTRLPVTHNKEVTNNASNFFFLFLFFRHRAPVTRFSSCVFCAFLPLLFPSNSCRPVLPTSARLATDRGEIVGESRLQRSFSFFSFLFLFLFAEPQRSLRRKSDTRYLDR